MEKKMTTRKPTDRERIALQILGGEVDGQLGQIERLCNNEQVPLAEDSFASLRIDNGNVVDVSVMPNGEIYLVAKKAQEAVLWKLGFPIEEVVRAPRIELLGCHDGSLPVYQTITQRFHRHIACGTDTEGGLDFEGLPSTLDKPDIHQNSTSFLTVWHLGNGAGSTMIIGDYHNRKVRRYPDVTKFISLNTNGYVLFTHPDKANEIVTWYDHDGQEIFQRQLAKKEHGEAAAFYDHCLWFSTQIHDWSYVYCVDEATKTCVIPTASASAITFFEPRQITWFHFVGHLTDHGDGTNYNRCHGLDQTVSPRRFGSWLIFQTRPDSKSIGYSLIGFHKDEPDKRQEVTPIAPWNSVVIQGNILLCASSYETCGEFITMRADSKDTQPKTKLHRLPGGCKAKTLQIVGDYIYGWSTIGSTLNIYRFRT